MFEIAGSEHHVKLDPQCRLSMLGKLGQFLFQSEIQVIAKLQVLDSTEYRTFIRSA